MKKYSEKKQDKQITAEDIERYNCLSNANHRGVKCHKMNWWVFKHTNIK